MPRYVCTVLIIMRGFYSRLKTRVLTAPSRTVCSAHEVTLVIIRHCIRFLYFHLNYILYFEAYIPSVLLLLPVLKMHVVRYVRVFMVYSKGIVQH